MCMWNDYLRGDSGFASPNMYDRNDAMGKLMEQGETKVFQYEENTNE